MKSFNRKIKKMFNSKEDECTNLERTFKDFVNHWEKHIKYDRLNRTLITDFQKEFRTIQESVRKLSPRNQEYLQSKINKFSTKFRKYGFEEHTPSSNSYNSRRPGSGESSYNLRPRTGPIQSHSTDAVTNTGHIYTVTSYGSWTKPSSREGSPPNTCKKLASGEEYELENMNRNFEDVEVSSLDSDGPTSMKCRNETRRNCQLDQERRQKRNLAQVHSIVSNPGQHEEVSRSSYKQKNEDENSNITTNSVRSTQNKISSYSQTGGDANQDRDAFCSQENSRNEPTLPNQKWASITNSAKVTGQKAFAVKQNASGSSDDECHNQEYNVILHDDEERVKKFIQEDKKRNNEKYEKSLPENQNTRSTRSKEIHCKCKQENVRPVSEIERLRRIYEKNKTQEIEEGQDHRCYKQSYQRSSPEQENNVPQSFRQKSYEKIDQDYQSISYQIQMDDTRNRDLQEHRKEHWREHSSKNIEGKTNCDENSDVTITIEEDKITEDCKEQGSTFQSNENRNREHQENERFLREIRNNPTQCTEDYYINIARNEGVYAKYQDDEIQNSRKQDTKVPGKPHDTGEASWHNVTEPHTKSRHDESKSGREAYYSSYSDREYERIRNLQDQYGSSHYSHVNNSNPKSLSQPLSEYEKTQTIEETEIAEEAVEEKSSEILDVHQYFRDDFDFTTLDASVDALTQIEWVEVRAESFENAVSNFSGAVGSLEFFVLDEKLMCLIEHLDKLKCRDDTKAMDKKIRVIKYIKSLQEKLDSRASNG